MCTYICIYEYVYICICTTHSENDLFTITLYVTQVLMYMTTPCDTHIVSPVSILRMNVIWRFFHNSPFSYAYMVFHIIMTLVLNFIIVI